MNMYTAANNSDPEPSAGEQKFKETHKIAMISSSAPNSTVGPTTGKTRQVSNVQSDVGNLKDGKKDVQHQYKMILHVYAERNSLGSPSYTNTTEGPPHALSFKSTVAIDGHSFDSPGFYKTLKEAEHAAAQVALLSLSVDAFQQDDNPFYKNLLQELAQNEGFILPAYKTIKSGESHKPTFISTVEIEGEKFIGKAAKSKKQAEVNAAKAAYIALTKRMSSRVGDLTFPVASEEDESIRTDPSSKSLTAVDPQGNHASACPLVSAPTKGKAKDIKHEHQGVESTEDLPLQMTPPDLSGLTITDCPTLNKGGIESYLLNNKVRVYTKLPVMKFPKGTVVLPIGKDKWVPVSLEFPNEINA